MGGKVGLPEVVRVDAFGVAVLDVAFEREVFVVDFGRFLLEIATAGTFGLTMMMCLCIELPVDVYGTVCRVIVCWFFVVCLSKRKACHLKLITGHNFV